MTFLKNLVIQEIEKRGGLSVDEYMRLALSHPEHGYYIKQDPFGATGDFITAPEISQIFGEIIGIWCLQQWVRLNTPSPISLVEAGPGRGTLMKDLIRGSKVMEEFHYAVNIHLIETSPILRSLQKQNLSNDITWHFDCSTLPPEPIIFIANELFDALPIQQFIKQDNKWLERIIQNDGEKLYFDRREVKAPPIPASLINKAPSGSIYEYCPEAHRMMKQICQHIKNYGGVALLIDYGHTEDACGDTLQAVKNHQYISIFEHIGNADLTAHVNFARLSEAVKSFGLQTSITTQREFLAQNGLKIRLEQLLKQATTEQADQLKTAYERLTSKQQMGQLFKAMVIYS